LTWLDRSGKALANVGPPAEYWTFALSPDETQIVASIADPERRTGDLWIVDASRGTRTRLTSRPTDEFMPRWSSNGLIYYTADPEGYYDVYRTPASGTGSEERVFQTQRDKWVTDISRDHGSMLLQVYELRTVYDLWIVPLQSNAKPDVLFAAAFPETEGQFSPDGRWIAYASRESGRDEILVSPRSSPSRRLQISVGGGTQPRWSRDGREIFYLTPDRKLMAASVRLHETTAEVLDTKPLFANRDFRLGWDPRVRTTYEVSADGRFLFPLPLEEADARPIVAVVDWAAGLEKR
jgi:Tol biopolymer transport system component